MIFEAGQKILFIGDSITDCDRRGVAAPYGNGYVSIVRNMIIARYPDLKLRFVNKGVSGNTTRNLEARWERDVLAEQPDWLSVKIGINDVWRAFSSSARDRRDAVPVDEYTAILTRLLNRALEGTRARLVLIQPYMIEPDRSQPMRKMMDEYGLVVEQLALKHNAILVPTQKAFDAVLAYTTPADWATDQIHPNAPGHAVIALAFLRAVGYEL